MSTAIRQEIDFKASPQRVYEALTDGKNVARRCLFDRQI